ncbi:hypothetical protein [Pseudomonas fluorescens]|uniref:Uncharacterized protein n=1 Tax=Pseudomonas fluorescens TaxID=294 RepID=A0A5E6U244_PSEFL|nr:hypothetical protein [Pseudomonas fluorescens]VVM99761.1 hypothetical protein PS659_03294 [Pseudomonas fluorescens]
MEPKAYALELNAQLSYLFTYTRLINEVDVAAALFGEFRGSQDAGWNTVATAHDVFHELRTLANKGSPLTLPEIRQLLCLYSQLSEAGGVYEGLLNTMQVAQLKPYNLWPFQNLVRIRKEPRAVIGPNANLMFRRLAQVASDIGLVGLSTLLEMAFRDDIRNAIAHADYILMRDGLRVRRRNGGQPLLVTNSQLVAALQISMFFFELLRNAQQAIMLSYRPARTVIGRMSENLPMPWTIESTNTGLSISSSSPGTVVDAAYKRQQRINDLLGGRVISVYLSPETVVPTGLFEEAYSSGFDVLKIDFATESKLKDLLREVTESGLWDLRFEQRDNADGALMASPFGFRLITSGAEFKSWLPPVEALRFE